MVYDRKLKCHVAENIDKGKIVAHSFKVNILKPDL